MMKIVFTTLIKKLIPKTFDKRLYIHSYILNKSKYGEKPEVSILSPLYITNYLIASKIAYLYF